MTATAAPTTQTCHLFIRATAEQIWHAITTPEYSARLNRPGSDGDSLVE